MPIPLLIHIGYHKTGTSFLQEHLFQTEAIGFCSPYEGNFIKKHIIAPHPFLYDPQQVRRTFSPGFQEVQAQTNRVPVLSRERLVGALHHTGRDSIPMAQRLAETFPEARILMVIREQRAMLYSSYNQYIRSGGRQTLAHYLRDPVIYKDQTDPIEFDPIRYHFHYLIQVYYDLFSRENVLVLPYELFRAQPHEFVTKIVEFCQLPVHPESIASLPYKQLVNPAHSSISLQIKRYLNYVSAIPNTMNGGGLFPSKRNNDLIKRGLHRLDRYLPQTWKDRSKIRMQALIQDTIGDYYAESNAQTQSLTKLNLMLYDYQLPLNESVVHVP